MGQEAALDLWKRFAYVDDLPEDIGPFRTLLEKYSKVPPSEIDGLLLRTVGSILSLVSSLNERGTFEVYY